ncbi:MAG: hypothetical protein AAF684_00455 [Pseudomonadota bacterium]
MLAKILALLVPLLAPTVLFFAYVYLRRTLFGEETERTTPWFWLSAAGLVLVIGALGWHWSQGVGTVSEERYVPAQMAPDGSIIPPTTAPRTE